MRGRFLKARTTRGGVKALKRHKGSRGAVIAPRKDHAEIEPPITVRSLSETTGIKANDLIRKLMGSRSCGEHQRQPGYRDGADAGDGVRNRTRRSWARRMLSRDSRNSSTRLTTSDESTLEPRPPVITILGHVDHGKTSLLDRIRRAERGGLRNRRHHPAYWRLSDQARRQEDHVRGYAGPRSVHRHACSWRECHGHRGGGGGGRRRRDAADQGSDRPCQGRRGAGRRRAQQD